MEKPILIESFQLLFPKLHRAYHEAKRDLQLAETFEEHEVTPSHNHYIVPPPAQLPYLNSYSSYSSLPMTHRSIHKRFLTDEIDATLVNSLRLMDLELRRKYQRTGQKLDGLCEDRFFCDFALKGRNVNSGALNKMLFNIALVTPEEQADKSGLGKIFKAVKRLNCDVFKCDKKL
ncbi:CLUMA_CG017034, isoform A [Clunio marinus]|uniref:CLUMA_CG017034, isoform A n=1 Tax=Clunio marinus TaxID=568069 RepID=A0A1J1IZ98_9DIPT|nr:CLUMA_CG017034, isoform A [Clunio marinus]